MSRHSFNETSKHRPKPSSPPPFSIWFSWPQREELDRLSNGGTAHSERAVCSFVSESVSVACEPVMHQ